MDFRIQFTKLKKLKNLQISSDIVSDETNIFHINFKKYI